MRYPVFIVVDDGGFPRVNPRRTSLAIPLKAYENIARLGRSLRIRIPVCVVASYVDIHGVWAASTPTAHARELVALLAETKDAIELGFHGLTHSYDDSRSDAVGEFFALDRGRPVDRADQERRIATSAEIFQSLGFAFPELFVPPSHAWEPGVTDHILASFGTRYIVSRHTAGERIARLAIPLLPRLDMGIYTFHTSLGPQDARRARRFIEPTNATTRLRVHRSLLLRPFHSYMTHIGNFMDGCMGFWEQFFGWVDTQPQLCIPADNREAVAFYDRWASASKATLR